ncbi:Dyp-type peroxidase [Mycetocola reblochoni]|uniref:Dyp-type peroxidase n=1 Tax=Mycetocola reblochoni TaxID=331618 RepID=UPI003F9B5E19
MTGARDDTAPPARVLSRRRLLLGGAAAGLGAERAVAAIVDAGATTGPAPEQLHGAETIPFHGAHQAGVTTAPQAHARFIALTLRDDVDRSALARLMRLLSDDASRLTAGTAALADSEPELAALPSRLTVTFGFGPRLVRIAAGESAVPSWLGPLPAFGIDRLEERWSDGDLLLQIGADDGVTVSHAARMLLKDARSFATVRWVQDGFRRSRGSERSGTTMRNLFGQIDGTVNLREGSADVDRLVWSGEGWLAGGTGMVVRRIAMNLDTWDRLDRGGREQSVGRTLDTGAPLTGTREHDEPDFAATSAAGFPVIPEFSHMRRARSDDPDERILRRGYNYEQAPSGDEVSDAGLLFVSYQADVSAQFVPIQRRLDELDLLNEWTTPIGSAVFAVPPGCAEGGFVGEGILS